MYTASRAGRCSHRLSLSTVLPIRADARVGHVPTCTLATPLHLPDADMQSKVLS